MLAGKGLACDGFLIFDGNSTEMWRYAIPNRATNVCEGEVSARLQKGNWKIGVGALSVLSIKVNSEKVMPLAL